MENVPGFIGQPVFDRLFQQLADVGYQYDYQVVFCSDYGMAKKCKRVVQIVIIPKKRYLNKKRIYC